MGVNACKNIKNELDTLINIFSRHQGYFQNQIEHIIEEEKIKISEYTVNELRGNIDEGEKLKTTIGTIRHKKNKNVFEGRYYSNGKQLSIYGKSKDEVLKKLLKIKMSPVNSDNNFKTFYSWFQEWFETFKKPNLSASSIKNISYCFEHYIKPNIKDCALNMLTALSVQQAVNKITASRMKKYTFDIVRACLKQAFKNKLLTENIADQLEPVRHIEKNGQALTLDEQKILEPYLKDERYKILKLYILTGCRPQEGLNLKWADISFENETVTIRGTKTAGSLRTIPLFANLKTFLSTIPRTGDFVFNFTQNSLKKRIDTLKALTGVNFNAYTLRHTFATRCVEAGIEMKVIQKWMGHTNVKTTATYYVHVQSEFEKLEAKKVNF